MCDWIPTHLAYNFTFSLFIIACLFLSSTPVWYWVAPPYKPWAGARVAPLGPGPQPSQLGKPKVQNLNKRGAKELLKSSHLPRFNFVSVAVGPCRWSKWAAGRGAWGCPGAPAWRTPGTQAASPVFLDNTSKKDTLGILGVFYAPLQA